MIHLSQSDAEAILGLIEPPADLRARFVDSAPNGLDLADHEVDELLELVTERLATHGFDASYELTSEGAFLEGIVDRLSSGS